MQEIEVKFLDINKSEIIKRLKAINAKKTFEGEIVTFFYDYPNRLFKKTKGTLRLRKKGKIAELTVKKLISKKVAKIMKEENFNFKSFKEADTLLKSLGLLQVDTIPNKQRISFELKLKNKKIHFDLDQYVNLPPFIEIESNSIENLKYAAKLLNLNFKEAKTFSANQLLKYYKKKFKNKH